MKKATTNNEKVFKNVQEFNTLIKKKYRLTGGEYVNENCAEKKQVGYHR